MSDHVVVWKNTQNGETGVVSEAQFIDRFVGCYGADKTVTEAQLHAGEILSSPSGLYTYQLQQQSATA